MKNTRKIIHVDMDCFFAAVEVKNNPELKGKAIAVGGNAERRGVIATASYEARKFGVRSAMSSAYALRLCPDLILISSNFGDYKKESQKIREIFNRYTHKIEPLSLDEAYLDVTESDLFNGSATLIAKDIRKTIFEELSLTASAGIASNKFLAKVCSDLKKPNGQYTLHPKDNLKFVRELPVEKIWGVGKKTKEKMHRLGFKLCKDLEKAGLLELQRHFGSFGYRLYDLCRAVDHREVKTSRVRKSLSVERTFPEDLVGELAIKKGFDKVYNEFCTRFKKSEISEDRIKTVFVKVKDSDFKTQTREKSCLSLPKRQMVEELMQDLEPRPYRLLGFGVRLKDSGDPSFSQMSLNLET